VKHFHRLAEGVDTSPLLNAIAARPKLWGANALRQEFDNSPHQDVEDIWLRFNDAASEESCGDDLEAVAYPAWHALPQARGIIFNLMRHVEAERLGRVMITKLAPGKQILPHADVLGAYAHYYTRYHVVLRGLPGVLFHCGDETVNMRTGEIWWFNAHETHAIVNNSADDRIHLLIDVRIPK
jgi:hypothetical protein